MDVVNAILKPVAESLMVPVKKHLGYLISCTQYLRNMRTKTRELEAARIGVEEHLNRNTSSCLEVPAQVRGWLEDVGKINEKVEDVPNDVGSCFNLKIRHTVGRKAFEIIEDIESVTRKLSVIVWTDHPIPLGKVNSMKPSTSTPSTDHHDDFQSREQTFTEALKALEPHHKSHMIALCGMGGVGKTTMMQRLKKVMKEKKMFDYIIVAVIGEKKETVAIQEAVANYIGIELKEKDKAARADKLRQGFMAKSDGGKNTFVVILDDVWQSIDMEDIGLSSFPNQGVEFKVLLTSRDRHVCTMMGVEANSILNVGLLEEAEAQSLFGQFVENFDPELHKIGEDIVRKCCGLPIAIKTLACNLRNRRKYAWKDALSRLEHHHIEEVVNEVFEMSYNNLCDQETKSVFLLCGLFPEDFNIPTEDLVVYGWGLKLFKKVYTIGEARTRLNTCIERLVHKNLLIESDDVGFVKMHDLALAFVLDMFSKVEHASIVNHGGMSEWPENDMTEFCKRISLTCKGISEFPRDLKFPNLSILKLKHGEEWLSFREDFYEGMEKLQVISYDNIKCPLLPSSLGCSTNLRVLYLHKCSLRFDCSSIGNLLNLEVLSFADSSINRLPSTLKNLKKLRVLDLTNCDDVHIDTGVLKGLVNLEELYTLAGGAYRKTICFTDDNCNEIEERSKTLSALEFQFYENNAQPKNMSFENLERFSITVGTIMYAGTIIYANIDSKLYHFLENSLYLYMSKGEIMESRLNELFKKTAVLHLSVPDDMNDLSDLEVRSSSQRSQSSSFQNLRVLIVSGCPELRYLFTLGVAKALSKLEKLDVEKCGNMRELIHSESSEEETLTFPKLKFLSLYELSKLSGLCHNVKTIELPQLDEMKLSSLQCFTSIYTKNKWATTCLLKQKVVIPKLEKLTILCMDKLEEIWSGEFSTSEEIKLREISVSWCNSLVNLFPCNPMPFLHHLEKLKVHWCNSIEAIFNIDVNCVGETGIGSSSSLKRIDGMGLDKLREVWRIKGSADNSYLHIHGFQAVERITIAGCKRFRNILHTPSAATNFYLDLGALLEIQICNCGESGRNNGSVESSQEKEINNIVSKEETSDIISGVLFPSFHIHSFNNLRKLELLRNKEVDVVFEIESQRSKEPVTKDQLQQLVPYLEELHIESMDKMSRVWKCNWNRFLILQIQQSKSPLHNLTTIHMKHCKSIKYLFSPLMVKLLSNLKKLEIEDCEGIEEVVSQRDDEDKEKTTSTYTHSSTSSVLCLNSLSLSSLPNLKCIGGANGENSKLSYKNTTTTIAFVDQFKLSQVGGVSWSLCQYAREINIKWCDGLSSVIPCYAAGHMQKLQVLRIDSCKGMKEVFETQGINHTTGCNEGYSGAPEILRLNNAIMLPNLKILEIKDSCNRLEHIFTFSTLQSLLNLEELIVRDCKAMKVIVKDEHGGEQTTSSMEVVVFPCLKSIQLVNLPELVGFFLGKNEFRCPSLDEVIIKDCPKMMMFTSGQLTAPKLKYINTRFGKYILESGLNFYVTTTFDHQTPFPSLDATSSCPATTSEGIPWSFRNWIEILHVESKTVGKIIPSNQLLHLQNLEKIEVSFCDLVEEVFEALEAGPNSSTGFDESSQTTLVKLPNLTQVELFMLKSLRYVWKSNQWTAFEFPNLTGLYIHDCERLEHVFTSSMVGSLLQLQELDIQCCYDMKEVIVNDANDVEEPSDVKMNEIVLPRLKTLKLSVLHCLKGFSLRKTDFSLPLLNRLEIWHCKAITTFTNGNLATPELKEITTKFGPIYAVGKDVNSLIKNINQEEFKRSSNY